MAYSPPKLSKKQLCDRTALWADEHLPLRKQARVLPPAIMKEKVAELVAF